MIGYMKPLKGTFSKSDRTVYQSIYCGLCRCLRYGYGTGGTVVLNYELTNALLLLGACAPEAYPVLHQSCSHTPLLWRPMAGMDQDAFHVAAGLTVTLAALEIRDNVIDDGKWFDRCLDRVFSSKDHKVSELLGGEHAAMLQAYEDYMQLERRAGEPGNAVTFSELVRASGVLAEVCTRMIARYSRCHQDQQELVCRIMGQWGEWIYLMDAVDDYREDLRKGRFNPLLLPDSPRDIGAYLGTVEANANRLLDGLQLNRYDSAVNGLFRSQLPEQRRRLCQNASS